MICILGGGAAGLFAAIRCKELNPSSPVLLLEKTNQLLSKVRISGGGRCNVTHACFDPNQLIRYYPRGAKELIGPFHLFQPQHTVAWFAERGVQLKTEKDGRIFPVTDSSDTIIHCLMHAASQAGVEIRKQQHVVGIQKTDAGFLIHFKNESLRVHQVLLATGSAPWGYEIAKQFGHQIIDPVPSLFTFNVPSSPLLDLAGIVAPHATVLLKEVTQPQQGPLLLTHWGFSGPAILKLSAWAARELYAMNYRATLLVNWMSSLNAELLYHSFLQQKQAHPLQALSMPLPTNLLTRLCSHISLDAATPLGKISHRILRQLAEKLHADAYSLEGKTTYKQEFVTAGGVHLKEVNFKTMESRITPGLFFAGEILNIDGITGGFNFQNAWTTGWLAGTAMTFSGDAASRNASS